MSLARSTSIPDPWAVPVSVACHRPLSRMPAFSHNSMSRSTRRSATHFPTATIERHELCLRGHWKQRFRGTPRAGLWTPCALFRNR